MNTMLKRIVSMFLCLVLVVGYLPAGALAAETEETVVTAAAEATNAPSVVELSDEATVVVAEEAAEAEENEEESLTADTGDPEEAVSEEETAAEEVPAEEETSEEVTSEEETTEEETSEEAAGEAVAFVLEADSHDVSLLDADAPVDAAIFFSDLHAGKPNGGSYTDKKSTLQNVLKIAKGTGLTFSSVTSVGDLFAVNGNEKTGEEDNTFITAEQADKDIYTGYIQEILGSHVTANYAWSDHDRTSDIPNVSGLLYGDAGTPNTVADDANYYVYTISMSDMSTGGRYGVASTFNTSKLKDFTDTMARLDPSKPVFIASHQPLHAKRGDNQNAYKWFEVINAAAEDHDIIFFWGHNHAKDESKFYYYGVGDDMTVQNGSSTKAVKDIKFAHICAGYLDPTTKNSDGQTRTGTILVTKIQDDSIQVTTYNSKGVYTGTNALNVTIDRQHEDDELPGSGETPDPTDPPEATEPSQPETPDVTIKDANGNDVEADIAVNNDASVQEAVKDLLTNAVAYDIDIEGNVGNIIITLPAKDIANPAVYYVPVDGAPVDMNATKNDDGTVSFETNHNSVYAVGERAASGGEGDTPEIVVPDGTTAEGSGTTGGKKTVYVQTSNLTSGKKYLIVNGNIAGDHKALANNNGTVAETDVTVETDSKIGTYIELDDVSDELWSVSTTTSYGSTYYRFQNGSYYLSGNRTGPSGNRVYNVILATNAGNWTWNKTNNRLSISVNSKTRYLYYNNKWTLSSSNQNVYFYVETEIDNTTSVPGTYSIVGNPETVEKVVVAETTLKLGSTLTFKPQSGTATTSDTSTAATYTVFAGSDIISVQGNTVTFTGKTGEAVVKVSYDTNGKAEGGVVTNYIYILAKGPTYTVTVKDGEKVVSGTTVAVKNVTAGDQKTLTASATYDMGNGAEAPQGVCTYKWEIPAEYQDIATVDANSGVVTFQGKSGAFYVIAALYVDGEAKTTAVVNFSVSTDSYFSPTDGTNDFPEYPNPGSITYDKTATAVGNFSQTGVAQMELSMTGVPYGSNEQFDIVLLLDRSSSMDAATRLADTRKAAKAFVEAISKNGEEWTGHNILVADYHGGKMTDDSDKYGADVYTTQEKWNFTYTATYPNNGTTTSTAAGGFQTIESQAEIDAIETKLDNTFKLGTSNPSGTDYDHALQYAQAALKAARTAGSKNKQFVVMMTDGVPTHLRYEGTRTHSKNTVAISGSNPQRYLIYGCSANDDMKSMFLKTANAAASNRATDYDFTNRGPNYHYEVISDDLKQEGVTIYTVGLGLRDDNGAWDYGTYNAGPDDCYNAASVILNDISGPAYETNKDAGTTLSKKDVYFFESADGETDDLIDKFKAIAGKITEAATNVVVTDKITDEYTMIFDVPQSAGDDEKAQNRNNAVKAALTGKELYIEVVNYELDSQHERTGVQEELIRVYLAKNDDGNYFAADASGNELPDLVFQAAANGKKAYWSEVGTDYQIGENEVVVTVKGIRYKFMQDGKGTHNVVSGAYAFGQVDSKTNMSNKLVIVTPYFAYSAATRMLVWTVDKLTDETEIALRYFLYLEDSSTEIGTSVETAPGPYETNEWAYMYYTNHLGHDCKQEFPIPQMTWAGAQVSYVFYLVNENGEPINKSGEKVDFANATFITQVFTEHVVWNTSSTEGTAELNIRYAAKDKLTSDYMIYDENAVYAVHVFQNEKGGELFNYSIIDGSSLNAVNPENGNVVKSLNTTKVYNTKAGNKYDEYGIYSAEDEGSQFNTTDANGNPVTIKTTKQANLDYANTTVAFAVVWKPALVEDTVVVDYGLDVLINVTQNDILQNTISGISSTNSAYGKTAMNTGVTNPAKFSGAALKTAQNNTISIEDENQIRFKQGDMQFSTPEVFYYESPVNFVENSKPINGYMYSKVTVIPATTIYYEDEFLTLESYSRTDATSTSWTKDTTSAWTTAGTRVDAVQDQDRPGESKISAALDADNNYGFDSAYKTMSTHSLGSAAMVHVGSNSYATADFSFYGTGFDVISTTSNTTGTIVVKVTAPEDLDGNGMLDDVVKSAVVDTYYGMDASGNVSVNTPGAIYQVPVIKIFDLPYGQYNVTITATYSEYFDHTEEAGYDLYLDAIRIYDPTGNEDKTSSDAYAADGEAFPVYKELRDQIIAASNVTVEENKNGTLSVTLNGTETGALSGAIFIDCNNGTSSIADYVSYGPNNELYLANNQAIAFSVDVTETMADVQLGIKVANGNTVTYKINGDSYTLNTATDMYYSIWDYVKDGEVVTIQNVSGGILSLTNIKTTFNAETSTNGMLRMSAEHVGTALMMLRKAPAVEEEVPETTVPETTVPETTVPETTEPEETKPVKPDNSELKAAVEAAKKLKSKDYTQASFKKLETAIKAAEKVLKDKKATQAQIDKALADLNAALETLEAVPNNSELKAAVEAAKKLKQKGYTQASFKKLQTAIKDAEKVLKDKKATQAQIDKALADLNAAVDGLETVAVKPIKPKPGGSGGKIQNRFKAQSSIVDVFKNLLKGIKR